MMKYGDTFRIDTEEDILLKGKPALKTPISATIICFYFGRYIVWYMYVYLIKAY